MTYSQAIRAARFEARLAAAVWQSRKCLGAKLALAAGLGYLLDPWQPVPYRIPAFGYSLQALILCLSLAMFRLLIPPRLEQHLAWRSHGTRTAEGATCVAAWIGRRRAESLVGRLVLRRRAVRLLIHLRRSLARLKAQWRDARAGAGWRDVAFSLLGYRLWWMLHAPFARRQSDTRALIVIGGAARSGTTLLRSILGRHPLIASGPETTVFLHRISSPAEVGQRIGYPADDVRAWQRDSRSQAEFIEAVQRGVLQRADKPIWAEKTPKNVLRFGFVRRRFPHARLVHIVRDGRDVICSLRQTPFAKMDHAPPDSAAAARRCAVQWWSCVRAGLRFRADPLYFELRYEELVLHPEPVLRALLRFIGVPWDDAVLGGSSAHRDGDEVAGAVFGSSTGRWRRDLSAADRRTLQPLIGPQLSALGYTQDGFWQGDGRRLVHDAACGPYHTDGSCY